jgi:hypothetical protein
MSKAITVTINPANNQITVSPDPVRVNPGDGRNVQMQWSLQTSGYTCPLNGIALKNYNGDEFREPVVSQQGTRFIMINKNTTIASFPYTVNLVRTSDQQTFSLDPMIINQGSP